MAKDYYNILGVEKKATQDEIKKSFRKLAHKFHPDKPTGDEQKFKEVNEAYQVVGDEAKRKQYDQYGATFDQQGGFGGGMNWEDFMNATRGGGQQAGGFNFGVDLGDIFGDMFGFGGSRRGQGTPRGRDVQVDVEIPFVDAVFGVEKELRMTKHNACDVCAGSGAEPGSSVKKCGHCDGQGQVRTVQRTILGAMQSVRTCDACHGSGSIPEKKCKHCGGSGMVRGESKLTVKIPAGIHDGATIRLVGKGEHGGAGSTTGDLFVAIHVLSHPNFVREGENIYTKTGISYPQAVLGDTISVETLDGKKQLIIPPGTQSNQQFRLRDLGVPYLRGGGRGDQYVTVYVDVPKKATKRARKLLEELKEEL